MARGKKEKTYLRLAALAALVLTIVTLIAELSYLFTWVKDASGKGEGVEVAVQNVANHFGAGWADLLMDGCFGLAGFGFVLLFAYLTLMFFLSSKFLVKYLRKSLLAFSLMFILSLVFAQIGDVFAWKLFPHGPGGMVGSWIYGLMSLYTGDIVTTIILIFLSVVWLVFASSSFAKWFTEFGSDWGQRKRSDSEDDSEEIVDDNDDNIDDTTEDTPAEEEIPQEEDPHEEDVPEEDASEDDDPAPEEDDAPEDEEVHEVHLGEKLDENVVEELPNINPTDELPKYMKPSLNLLEDRSNSVVKMTREEVEANIRNIIDAFASYKIEITNVTAKIGPTVTLYELTLGRGVTVSSVKSRETDIGVAMGMGGRVRIVVLTGSVGVEVPNRVPSMVSIKSILNSEEFRSSKAELPIALGYTITQKCKTFDLTDAPHLLVAGATKQGKSVGLNVIITSLLYAKHPSEMKLVFIDPKMVEFNAYAKLLKHYLAVLPTAKGEEEEKADSIVKTPEAAQQVLSSLCVEMDERYALISKSGVPNVKQYNKKFCERRLLPTEGHHFMPYIVAVIDEFNDLITSGGTSSEGRKCAKSINQSIIRLAQKGRAAGIHLIIATQRPSVQVITGEIKANFPTRIAFRVIQQQDSMTILGQAGAERLIGNGDMLYYSGVELERVQCAYISSEELADVTGFIESQKKHQQCYNTPYYLPMPPAEDGAGGVAAGNVDMSNLDPVFEDAARLVVQYRMGSVSNLQRKLGIGFARAGKVMDQLEAAGIVGPSEPGRPREILVENTQELENILDSLR